MARAALLTPISCRTSRHSANRFKTFAPDGKEWRAPCGSNLHTAPRLLAHRVETGSASEGEAGGTERFARQCPQQAAHPLFQVPIADVARVMGHLGSRKYRRPS